MRGFGGSTRRKRVAPVKIAAVGASKVSGDGKSVQMVEVKAQDPEGRSRDG